MPYYTRTYNPQPTARVTSQELKNEFQSIDNALDAVEADVGKGIRAPEATTALPNAASRALKVLSFDASGNPIATVLAGDVADAADNAAIATAKAAEAAASAVAAHNSELAAAASAATVDIPALESGKYLSNNGVDMVWQAITPPQVLQRTITGADTLIASDQGKLINASGTFTLAVTAAATLGNGWYCWLRNASNGDVTVDPASAELVDGVSTITIKPGFAYLLTCSGTAFSTMVVDTRKHSDREQITTTTTRTAPAGCYVMRAYAFGAGGAGVTNTSSGGGGGCAYGDIAVTPGETVTFTISAGIAKVTTQSVDRLTGSPASTVTAGTANKHASVTNGGSYSGGAGVSTARCGGASSGSPLGTGKAGSGEGGSGWGGFGSSVGVGGSYQSAGGGVGGNADIYAGGPGLSTTSTDPLLYGLTAGNCGYGMNGGTVTGLTGSPGQGGTYGCAGGFGGGGGASAVGGFGGGGGGGSNAAAGGYGGGGANYPTGFSAGGAAAIIVFWG